MTSKEIPAQYLNQKKKKLAEEYAQCVGKRVQKWEVIKLLGNKQILIRCDCGLERAYDFLVFRRGLSGQCAPCARKVNARGMASKFSRAQQDYDNWTKDIVIAEGTKNADL